VNTGAKPLASSRAASHSRAARIWRRPKSDNATSVWP
jgi:hypothetical protein